MVFSWVGLLQKLDTEKRVFARLLLKTVMRGRALFSRLENAEVENEEPIDFRGFGA